MTLLLWLVGIWLGLCGLLTWALSRWFRFNRDGPA